MIYRLVVALGGGGTEALYQSSGTQRYISISDMLLKSPTIEQEK
ncbi:hypothetical protein NIES2111_20110 [Nostoc sp. NIES-2111]|nr:hypothetical protein NIES2111_20110 [Nostoc sp. NIES-2111]